jgi:2-polyprenyl-6-methoxyphenol hydroxylase-like FAD-dependent oxidoreductase
MRERFDVAVVGARCAGATLATLLARAGLRVVVLEQATFPRDTLSSHVFEADALAFLGRLGLTERLRATGAPFVNRTDIRLEDVRITTRWPQAPGDVGGMMSIRRHVLDPILAEFAAQAGADVRLAAKVVALVPAHDRIAGVRVAGASGEHELAARLVVGADGRGSTVARLTRARSYNIVQNQRVLYWGYYEGAAPAGEATFMTHRWAERFVLAIPADAGLYQVLVWPEFADRERHRGDHEAMFAEQVAGCKPLSAALEGARRVGGLHGAVRWSGYFREASGRGWVLVGDAGHFKDPAPGRGIGDAFCQAQALAQAITGAIGGSDAELDAALARFGRWRDGEFAEHYWFAGDLGQAGAVPAVLVEIVRRLDAQGRAGEFLDILNHRVRPSQLLTPAMLVSATARLMGRERGRRAAIAREVAALAAQDTRRRWRNRRPAYAHAADAEAHAAASL